MSEFVLEWATVSFVVSLFIAAGLSVMSTSPPEFSAAKWCFNAAYVILILRLGWWMFAEQPSGGVPYGYITAPLLAGLLSGLWIMAANWVDIRQATFVDENDRRAKRREQRDTLTHFVEKGTQARETYKSLELVPRTAAPGPQLKNGRRKSTCT